MLDVSATSATDFVKRRFGTLETAFITGRETGRVFFVRHVVSVRMVE